MITKTYTFEKYGKSNEVYTLSNANGYEVDILNYGARITRIWAPDKKGNFDDIIVGCAKPEEVYAKRKGIFLRGEQQRALPARGGERKF